MKRWQPVSSGEVTILSPLLQDSRVNTTVAALYSVEVLVFVAVLLDVLLSPVLPVTVAVFV
jgi:hypothetical protein